MTPMDEPLKSMRRQVWASAATVAGLACIAGIWALQCPVLPASPSLALSASAVPMAHHPGGKMAATWEVTLWQPLSDVPVEAAHATPLTLKLFSIMAQDGTLTAAIDPGDGSPLVYAHSGDTIKGVTVTSVDAKGVSLTVAGAAQRLDLVP
jgi:hypothetical protein